MMKLLILGLIGSTAAQTVIHNGPGEKETDGYGLRGPHETHAEHQVHLSDHEIASHERFEERVAHGYPSPYEKDHVHMYSMRNNQFQLVYDCLSFSLACMMSTTVFLFMRLPSVTERYKSALIISGLVTFIAAYHYIRIFNSWVDAYSYPSQEEMTKFLEKRPLYSLTHSPRIATHSPERERYGIYGPDDKIHHHVEAGVIGPPTITGTPFNDAYRYMDWLLTVPLLLMEIVLVMSLSKEEANSKCWVLGIGSALMIVSGYKGELIVQGDLSPRWHSWCLSMCFFLYVVYTLLIGLSAATNAEPDPVVKGLIQNVQLTTVISWCTYPIVYLFPMMGIGGASAVIGIQIGYCASDIISKCGVGLMIYQITITKSNNERSAKLLG
jgi:hypothetical protein